MTVQQPERTLVAPIEPTPDSSRYVRRSEADAVTQDSVFDRTSVVALAIIGIVSMVLRRLDYDARGVVLAELLACVGLIVLLFWTRNWQRIRWAFPLTAVLVVLMPWGVNQIALGMGHGNDIEILMLTNLGWGSIALALVSKSSRGQNLSVVCSGFLTLFTVFTSDSPEITLVVYLWMAVCLWWLVSKHWADVSTLRANRISRSLTPRVLTLVVGCGAFVLAVLLVSDSVPVLRKLRAEIMPTSGGTSSKDRTARSGVGNGDALIAAKNHATSFGAVETDFFLDSVKPSLFDVFSDQFGNPFRKKKVERAAALSQENVERPAGRIAEANRSSGGEFSVERKMPKAKERLEDLASNALMFWEGRSGVRLAVQRLDQFDGHSWSQSKVYDRNELRKMQPQSVEVGEDLWFAPPGLPVQGNLSPFVSAFPEAMRFTRYGDNVIPAPSGLQLWHIDMLRQADFFAFTPNSCLLMPGRDTVPDYTVVRFINSELDAEKLDNQFKATARSEPSVVVSAECEVKIAQLVKEFASDEPRGWSQVQAVVYGVRSQFDLQNTSSEDDQVTSLADFLDSRSGPSYLFATTAALVLDRLGYQTRLVTGFYANPKHFVSSESATAILPQDAHVWLEVNAGHGYWVPLEPSPGFRQPPIRSTWAYWLRTNWPVIAAVVGATVALLAIVYFSRAWLFNFAMLVFAPLLNGLPMHKRLVWMRRLLDIRWRFIGESRPSNLTARRRLESGVWGLNETQQAVAVQFCELYDASRFGAPRPGLRSATQDADRAVLSAMPGIIRSVRRTKHRSEKPEMAAS
ncbi:MAG TPA: hypothetical protein DDW52_08015 [Planctomycetaceae bacterium]|nr:hypothetical protein [Planctomycetaceae bacterium]